MLKPRKPSCAGCPNNLYYDKSSPQKQMGVMMHFGDRFCTGTRKVRKFKRSDPAVAVPSWCPKRKTPHELRVYCFKDTESWMMHELYCQDLGDKFCPEGHRYAVEYELHTDLSAAGFLERCRSESDAELLGVAVHRHHVVEIDDGLEPACFYKADEGYRYEPFFAWKFARENKRENMEEFK